MPLCSKCSNLVSQNSAFCNHCGTAVNAPLPTGSTQPQMSVIAPNNQGFSVPIPPPLYASVPPPAKGKSKVFPIILGSLAILILPFVALNLYRHHQNQIFWESLKTRPTEITKDDFEKVCAHKDDCVGRFIVWEGTVDGDAFQDAKEFHIKSVNGRADVYTIDPLPTRLHDGDDIIFDGFLGEVNSLSPDTINTGYVRKVVATADQLAQQKKAADDKQAQDDQLKQQKLQSWKDSCTQGTQQFSLIASETDWTRASIALTVIQSAYSGASQPLPPKLVILNRILDLLGNDYPASAAYAPSAIRQAVSQAELNAYNAQTPEGKANKATETLRNFTETFDPQLQQLYVSCSYPATP
jgi:hypothetical protein